RLSGGMKKRHHQVIAEWMEHQQNVYSNEEYCAMLAGHQERGGGLFQAGLTYLRAGNLARSRYANGQACEYFENGLALIDEGAVSERLDALHNYGDVLQLTGRVDDALAAFGEM